MLAEDISKLMLMIPQEELSARKEGTDRIEGGAFDGVMDKQTPFMYKVCILLIAGASAGKSMYNDLVRNEYFVYLLGR